MHGQIENTSRGGLVIMNYLVSIVFEILVIVKYELINIKQLPYTIWCYK